MTTPLPIDPSSYQEWLKGLEQKWQAGLIPDPQAVAIILVNYQEKVLLQLRDNHPDIAFANFWTLPGGVVENNETPEQAAHRELREETGLQLNLSLWKIYKRQHHDRQFFIEQHIYWCKLEREIRDLIVGEGQALHFFKHNELSSISIAFGFDKLLDDFFSIHGKLFQAI